MPSETSQRTKETYLIKNGSVISVDPELGTFSRADVLIREGAIENVGNELSADGAQVIDATDMIVMPGLVDTHYHMWSALGRNYLSDGGIGYYQAKWATADLYDPDDFYNSVLLGLAELASGGVTTVHNWSHNNRGPKHVDAELRAHREAGLRGRYSIGHIDRLPADVVNTFSDLDRVEEQWFGNGSPIRSLMHLGANLRGIVQSDARVFHEEMQHMLKRRLPVSIHATQTRPNLDDAADYEQRGYLGPNFLFCHYLAATDNDRAVMARTGTPLTFATHSEFRLGENGDPRAALLRARAAGVSVSLSCDASSIAPPNMFETMRLTWNMGIPWKGIDTVDYPPLGFVETIEMATIKGARALGLGKITGSLTPGKRADVILIRTNDVNIAPLGNVEATVVQSATPANVDTVIVDGRLIKKAGKLVGFNVHEIVARAKASSIKIRTAAGGVLKPVCAGCGNLDFQALAC